MDNEFILFLEGSVTVTIPIIEDVLITFNIYVTPSLCCSIVIFSQQDPEDTNMKGKKQK